MSLTQVGAERRWRPIVLWVVKGLLALTFLAAGGAKFYGVPMLVEEFEHIGLGQWFRYLTGSFEITGALLILFPAVAAFGGLLLSCVMIGATIAHLFVIGGSPIPALVLLVLAATVAIYHRAQFAMLLPTTAQEAS